jgi:hypothetical protein
MLTRSTRLIALIIGLLGSACLERELTPLTPCLVSGVTSSNSIDNIDKIDLLFVVDNSSSMREEQDSLRRQLPKLIRTLTSGERSPDDPRRFQAIKDLHLGVVSTDMGTPGIAGIEGCDPNGGDDGRLQNLGRMPGCAASYPSFLSFRAGADPDAFSNDFTCVAMLGTGGCGFEQQLEAPLKALWPSVYTDAMGNVVAKNPVTFAATSEQGLLGRGDVAPSLGGNGGFLRNDPKTGLSLIAIVLVTDEEDCSSRRYDHLVPPELLSPDSPLASQDMNLRCHLNKQNLYDVRNRYLPAFQALRPGRPDLVLFAAISGVPVDLVSSDARQNVDFSDPEQRDAYYAGILNDGRMTEAVDPGTAPGSGNGNLVPSCVRPAAAPGGKPQTALPPRRIVELAQAFGENGVVQSICQDDFGPAMDVIIDAIAAHLQSVCLPRPLVRKADGQVRCHVVWELPKPGAAPETTITRCEDAPAFLKPVGPGRAATNESGGQNCEVQQLALTSSALPAGLEGWYYDDFSEDLVRACQADRLQRVAYTHAAKPPTGVVEKLECLNEVQRVPVPRDDLDSSAEQPEIGDDCGNAIAGSGQTPRRCELRLRDGSVDPALFCHGERNVCVLGCASANDCPAGWECDARAASVAAGGGGAFCVNPTCVGE